MATILMMATAEDFYSQAIPGDFAQAILERRMDMFGKHGSPPQLFQGPLAQWTRRAVASLGMEVSNPCYPNSWVVYFMENPKIPSING